MLDVGASTIAFTHHIGFDNFYSAATSRGWVFSSLNFGTGFTNVVLTSIGFTGLTASRASFTGNSVSINLQGRSVRSGNGFTLRLAAVPVPAPGLPLLAGLGGSTLMRRRRV